MNIEIFARANLRKSKMEDFTHSLSHICEHENIWMEANEQFLRLQIGAEGIMLIELKKDELTLYARTQQAGPGFHAYVCTFIDKIHEELDLEWIVDDQSMYYENRQFETLKYQYFYRWLLELQLYVKKHEEPIVLSWDVSKYIPKEIRGQVVCPLGYIERLKFIESDIETLALDFFVWNNLEQDEYYFRNNALYYIWQEGYFEYSGMNDESIKYANMIIDYLEIAYEHNPDITIPYKTYDVICDALKRVKLLKHDDNLAAQAIGYRAYTIAYPFNDWLVYTSGFCELSFDESTQSKFIMAPYLNSDEPWTWFIEIRVSDQKKAYIKAENKIKLDEDRDYYASELKIDQYCIFEATMVEKDKAIDFVCHMNNGKDFEMINEYCQMAHIDHRQKGKIFQA